MQLDKRNLSLVSLFNAIVLFEKWMSMISFSVGWTFQRFRRVRSAGFGYFGQFICFHSFYMRASFFSLSIAMFCTSSQCSHFCWSHLYLISLFLSLRVYRRLSMPFINVIAFRSICFSWHVLHLSALFLSLRLALDPQNIRTLVCYILLFFRLFGGL